MRMLLVEYEGYKKSVKRRQDTLNQEQNNSWSQTDINNKIEKLKSEIRKKQNKINRLNNDHSLVTVHYQKAEAANFFMSISDNLKEKYDNVGNDSNWFSSITIDPLKKGFIALGGVLATDVSAVEELVRPYKSYLEYTGEEKISRIEVGVYNGRLWGEKPEQIHYHSLYGINIESGKHRWKQAEYDYKKPSQASQKLVFQAFKYIGPCEGYAKFRAKKKGLTLTQEKK